jgi:hypothetical protein
MKFESHDPNLIQKLSEFFHRAPEECLGISVFADGVVCSRVVSFDTGSCVVEICDRIDYEQADPEPKIITKSIQAQLLEVVGPRGWSERFKPLSETRSVVKGN